MAARRPRWGWVLAAAATVVLVGLSAIAVRVAGLLTEPGTTYPFGPNNAVLAVDGDLVTIGAGVFSSLPGSRWGLQSASGSVEMVELVELDEEADTVTWRVEGPPDARPAPGDDVRVDEIVFEGDPTAAVGLPFEERTIVGPIGELPTWVVPTTADERRGTVVYVHAWGYDRQQANRYLPALTAAGWDVVVPTYRGDVGAPPWPGDRKRFGTDEWVDLEAVLEATASDGRLVLYGASFGGSMVIQLLDRSALAEEVDAVVLDGAPLSLDEAMRFQSARAGVPDLVAPIVLPLGQVVADVLHDLDSASLEQVADDGTFDVPTLLLHATADTQVPAGPAERLAEIDEDVQLVRLAGAGHVVGWNTDAAGFEESLLGFLARVP